MNKENTEKLLNRFSFFHPELPITESLMAFGFEVGDGWFDLIWDLCEKIEPLVYEDFIVLQVKEKFGSLRFYVGSTIDKVFDLIEEAEEKSNYICESCGKPSVVRKNNGWFSTVCDECKSLALESNG